MKFHLIALAVASVMTAGVAHAQSAAPSFSEGAVVRLKCGMGTGSAVILGGDTILTANHVVSGDTCSMWPAGARGEAFEIVTQDPAADLVVARVADAERPSLSVSCDGLVTGERYWLVGYANKMERTISIPVVATDRVVNARMPSGVARGLRMVEAAGGAVLDAQGRMVAFNSAVGTDWGSETYVKELKGTPVCPA
ncbi:serine protease [Brevundimonas sp. 357]|uniref:S1 family peptidase n=1 Tax=Brevundimonas sp. 357 TaxID=2555782 RepID=UPI000F78C8E4|nr:serine protease [Brevundimonas sp. 357]RSB43066.1 serine protease [Brevundimonas sp. 357]